MVRLTSILVPICVSLLLACVGEIDVYDDDELGTAPDDIEPIEGKGWNGKGWNSIALSALTTDPETVIELLSLPLATSVYSADTGPGDRLYNLLLRASEPETVGFFDYLVGCALAPDQEPVKRKNPLDPSDITVHHGALGFCPQWAYGSVIDDKHCTQKVSACLISRINEFAEHVPISFRGFDGSFEPIELENPLTPYTDRQDAFEYCYSPDYGPDAECGWEPGFVGSCQPGKEVVVGRPSGCTSYGPYDSRRVCAGVEGCDMDDPTHIASGWTCLWGDISFTCPSSGAYTVMTRTLHGAHHSETTLRSPISGAGAAYFPATEKLVFRFREGGFWGQLFDPTGDTVSIRTRLRVGTSAPVITKEFSEDGGLTWTTQLPPNPARVIYQELYACHSAMWDFYPVFEKGRVCAGSTGFGCAANAVGNCEPWTASPEQDHELSRVKEGVCAIMDASPLGDGDYAACNDQKPVGERRVWEHVVTTYLVHPCDLWGPAAAARETCLDNPLPPVQQPFRPRPRPIGGVLVTR